MKPKVLATSWHTGAINAIIPVIKKLKQEKKVDIITIGHQYSEEILDNQKIKYKRISDYDLKDVSLESMNDLLKQESPNLILTGTSIQDENNIDVLEQTITLAGRQNKIFSIAVLDHWENISSSFDNIFSEEQFKFLPDKIAIMDNYAEKDMLKKGFEKDRLIITGNPHFDNLEAKAKRFSEKEKNNLRQQIGLGGEVLFFYVAGAWKKEKSKLGFWDLDNLKLVEDVLRELSECKSQKYALVVKLHPRVPEEDFFDINNYIQKKNDRRIRLSKDIHPHKLILASEATLTPFSTLGIEAVYMGKPCISLQPNLQGKDHFAILTENGMISVGYTKKNCKELIRQAYIDSDYREELIQQASCFRTDGKAAERVTDLVYKFIEIK